MSTSRLTVVARQACWRGPSRVRRYPRDRLSASRARTRWSISCRRGPRTTKRRGPTVSVQVSGGGSGVGIAGLIDGILDIAAASREMKAGERQSARARNGAEPKEFTVALDALAIYVHKDNPLDAISIEDLAEIYGEQGRIVKWSQLGITQPGLSERPIIRVGRQNNSGTYAYFREVVLGGTREYKLGSIDQSGSKDVVALVSRTPCAIGYSGMAFATSGVKVVKISTRRRRACDPAERDSGASTAPTPSLALCISTRERTRRSDEGVPRLGACARGAADRARSRFRARTWAWLVIGSAAPPVTMRLALNRRLSTLTEPTWSGTIRLCGWSAIVFVFAIFFFVFREGAPVLFGTLDHQGILHQRQLAPGLDDPPAVRHPRAARRHGVGHRARDGHLGARWLRRGDLRFGVLWSANP